MSLIRDTVPATPPATSGPLSRSADGEQADLTKLSTLKTEAVRMPGNTAQPSPSLFVEVGPDVSLTPIDPTSSSWMMPAQNGPHTSGLFAGPSSGTSPQDGFISTSWAMPPQTGQPSAMPAEATSWMTPAQNGSHTSGLFTGSSSGTLPQDGSISVSWVQPSFSGVQGGLIPGLTVGAGFTPASTVNPEPFSTFWTVPPQIEQGAVALSQVATIAQPQQAQPAILQPKRPSARKKRVPLWLAVGSVIMVIMIVLTQGNGTVGAWAADTFRSIAGPVATAQIEAWYLNAQNQVQQWQYQAGGQHVASPFQVTPKSMRPTATPTPPLQATLKPMPLLPMKSYVSPTLDGEGTWNGLEQASKPYNYLPLDARAFIRPDPAFPYAIVTLLQFDTRFSRLHIVSGTQEPGGPRGAHGAGVIDPTDLEGNTLLAALNGGFKYADGAYGIMTGGKVYVPPQSKAATIAITRSGQLIMGAWGVDARLNSNNPDLVAWRQNASLLINKGVINPLTKDGAAWGGTILNSEYTWRSGLGITAQGNLVYAAGNALVPETLGKALYAAGAVTAMETDINPFWVRAFLYQKNSGGSLTITKLNTAMQGTGNEYLNVDLRDFFYLTRYAPPKNGAQVTPTTENNK
jgi:hypothetical protein